MSVWSNFCRHRGVLISGLMAVIFQTIIMTQNQVESKEFTSSLQNDITDISMLYSENKKYVIYRNTNKKECYIDDVLIANQSLKESKYSRTLFVGAKIDSSHKLYPEIGQDVIEFCKEYMILLLEERPLNYRKIDSSLTRKKLKRIRRETPNSSSKRSVSYRGQTQTQFISLDNGNEKSGGVAEAFAEPDRSQARVSGTIGMGQAQSQSGNYDNCEECVSTKTINISGPSQELTVTKSLDKINIATQTGRAEIKTPTTDAGFQQIPQSTVIGNFVHNPEIKASSNTTEKQLGIHTQLASSAVLHPTNEQKPFLTTTYHPQSIDSHDQYPVTTTTSSTQPSTSTIKNDESYAINRPYYSKSAESLSKTLFPSNQQEGIPGRVHIDQFQGKQSFIPFYQPEILYYPSSSSGRTATTKEEQKNLQTPFSITQPNSNADQTKTYTKETLQTPLPLPSPSRTLTETSPVLSPFTSPADEQIPIVIVNPSRVLQSYLPSDVQSQIILPQPTAPYKYPAEGMEIISSAPRRPSGISDAVGTQTPVKLPQPESSQTIIQPRTQQTSPNQFTGNHSFSPIQPAQHIGIVPSYSQSVRQQQIYPIYPQQQPIQSANRPYYSESSQNAVNDYKQIYQPSLHYTNYGTDQLQTENYPSSGIKIPFFSNQDYPGQGHPARPLKQHFGQPEPQQHHTQETYIDQTRHSPPQYSTFPLTGSSSSYHLIAGIDKSTSKYPGASISYSMDGENNSQILTLGADISKSKNRYLMQHSQGSGTTFLTNGVSSSQTPISETESKTAGKYPPQYSPRMAESISTTIDEYYPRYSSEISASNSQVSTPGTSSRTVYEHQLQNSPETTKTNSKTIGGYSPQYSTAVNTAGPQISKFETSAKTEDGYLLQYSPEISTSNSQVLKSNHPLQYFPKISTSNSQAPTIDADVKTADRYPLQYSPRISTSGSQIPTYETGTRTADEYPLQYSPGISTSGSQVPAYKTGTRTADGYLLQYPPRIGTSGSQAPTYETHTKTVDGYPLQYPPRIGISGSQVPTYETGAKTADGYPLQYSPRIGTSGSQVPAYETGTKTADGYPLQYSPRIGTSGSQVPAYETGAKTADGYPLQYSPRIGTSNSQVSTYETDVKTANRYPLQYSPEISTSGSPVPTYETGAKTADGYPLQYSPRIGTSGSQVPTYETDAKTADGYQLQYSPRIGTSSSQVPTYETGAKTADGYPLQYSPGISANSSHAPLSGGNSRTTDRYPLQHSPGISTSNFQVPPFEASARTTDENQLQYSPGTNENNFKIPISGSSTTSTISPLGSIVRVDNKTVDDNQYSPRTGLENSSNYFPSTVRSESPITGGNRSVDMSQGTLFTVVDSESGDAQSISSISVQGNDTKATASSQGKTKNGKAQSQVSGTYTGSFSAQAQTSDNEKSVESQIFGNSSEAISSSQGRAGKSNSQSQIRYSHDTGTTSAESQGNGINYTMNTQIQAGLTGGIADAQSSGSGSTSSQAQIGFLPYDDSKKDQQSFFDGGGTASAQSNSLSGQSETQLRGSFQYGVSYNGAAQSAAGRSIRNITRPSLNTSNFSLPQGITLKQIFNDQKGIKNLNNKDVSNNNNNYNNNDLSTNNSSDKVFTLTNYTSVVKAHENNINATSSLPLRYSLIDVTARKSEANNERVSTESKDLIKEDEMEETDDNDNDDDDYYGKKEHQNKKKNADSSLYPITRNKNKIENKTPMTQTQSTFIRTRNHDVHVTRDSTDKLKEGDILQPGQIIPSSNNYTIPRGFRGRITSVAGDKTEANAYPGSQAQAQTIVMKPGGSGKLFVTDKSKDLYFITTDQHREMHNSQSPNRNPYDTYVTVTKSETGELNNGDKKYSHTYYTKSSTCGYFTFSCNIIEGKNGRTKICTPNAPTTVDGTPC